MVVDKLFEFIEDIERFCVNHRWSRFFNDWETGDEALDEYAMIYKNCCNDIDEEKDAANDIFTELTEYMDCLYNYIDDDYVKLLEDEKQNARKWLDKVEKVIGSCVFSLKGNDLKGFLIKGYQMCHLIKEAAVKTPDEYYGSRRTDVMPYYIGENKNQLFNNILNEDNMGKLNEKRIELSNPYPVKKNEIIDIVERSTRLVHTATDDKTIQLYIYSNGCERPEAFAEVEITSIGYILHGAEGYDYQGSSLKEFENDLKDIVFHFDAVMSKRFGENKEQLFDSILNEADDTYKAKVNGKWLKGNKLVKDKKDADTFESKTEPTQRINQMKKDGKLNKNAKPTIMKEYVSNQITNTFMRHGVEKYFHEYIIVVDDDWYTPCEFISEFGLEDSFGPEYVFEQVVIAVKSSIKWLKNQGYQPDENGDDEAYNLWEMIDFIGSLKENTMENKNQLFESLLQAER